MRYFYKVGYYKCQKYEMDKFGPFFRPVGWDISSWTKTPYVREVSRKFYFEQLLPDEEKIIEQEGKGHHFPFKLPNKWCKHLNILE